MIRENSNLSDQIAYFIDFSIQEIPHIIYIAYEIGGTIYTNSVNTFNIIKNEYNNIKVKYFKSIDKIKNDIIFPCDEKKIIIQDMFAVIVTFV